jgi:hypothetical protein
MEPEAEGDHGDARDGVDVEGETGGTCGDFEREVEGGWSTITCFTGLRRVTRAAPEALRGGGDPSLFAGRRTGVPD